MEVAGKTGLPAISVGISLSAGEAQVIGGSCDACIQREPAYGKILGTSDSPRYHNAR
jgi:hypothetical protein